MTLKDFPTDTLESLCRAFIQHRAGSILVYYNRLSPKWQINDLRLFSNDSEHFKVVEVGDSQETIYEISLTASGRVLLEAIGNSVVRTPCDDA